jgi:SLAP domain-containing protein
MLKKFGQTARGFIIGCVLTALTITLANQAIAALTSRTIEVSTGVNIQIEGEKFEPTDVNGKSVETFVYNSTTYLPVRAVSEALGFLVSYDAQTQTANIRRNQFYSETRTSAQNKVTISSKNIYYDGNKLVAEMFVDNGLAVPVYDLRNISITLSNDAGVIAQGDFSGMQGAFISANSYITWRFTFTGDALLRKGADLTGQINCKFRAEYSS